MLLAFFVFFTCFFTSFIKPIADGDEAPLLNGLFKGEHMKVLQNKVVALGIAAFFAIFVSACGDDSSSGPSKQISDEEITGDDELSSDSENSEDVKNSCSSNKEMKSSSSSKKVTDVSSNSKKSSSSSSEKAKSSSSSAKPSTSSTKATTSSSTSVKGKSSSSQDDEDDGEELPDYDFEYPASANSEPIQDLGECNLPNATERVGFGINEIYEYICKDGRWKIMTESDIVESSSSLDLDLQFNPDITYGEFVDDRDGKTYKTVVVKNRAETDSIVMFAENLNYGTQVKAADGQVDDGKVEKFCYNDDSLYCNHGFGGLYTWAEAMNLPSACNEVFTGSTEDCPEEVDSDAQGICPDGWHVMHYGDADVLLNGSYLSRTLDELISRVFSADDGEYKDEYGASIFFSGKYGGVVDYEFKDAFLKGYLWTPKEPFEISGGFIGFYDYLPEAEKESTHKTEAFSVRCVQNQISD